jgi:hypothetical protein
MLPALLHLMRKPETSGFLRHIVLLTDGDLGNEEQIFAALRSNLGGARLYTVAIGSAPNFFLATKMAQFGRGTFTHIAEIGEIREQMGRLLSTIESPVLTRNAHPIFSCANLSSFMAASPKGTSAACISPLARAISLTKRLFPSIHRQPRFIRA